MPPFTSPRFLLFFILLFFLICVYLSYFLFTRSTTFFFLYFAFLVLVFPYYILHSKEQVIIEKGSKHIPLHIQYRRNTFLGYSKSPLFIHLKIDCCTLALCSLHSAAIYLDFAIFFSVLFFTSVVTFLLIILISVCNSATKTTVVKSNNKTSDTTTKDNFGNALLKLQTSVSIVNLKPCDLFFFLLSAFLITLVDVLKQLLISLPTCFALPLLP